MSYVDTSVLASLFLTDVNSAPARAAMQAMTVPPTVSTFAAAEFAAVVGRKLRTGSLAPDRATGILGKFDGWCVAQAEMVDVEPADHRLAASFVRRFDLGLRAPDALHIAVCQRLRLPLLTFDAPSLRGAAAWSRLRPGRCGPVPAGFCLTVFPTRSPRPAPPLPPRPAAASPPSPVPQAAPAWSRWRWAR